MLATLGLGVAKEVRTNKAAAEAAIREQELQTKSDQMNKELGETYTRLKRTAAELGETRTKLAAVEPNLLQAMIVATAGIRRESDFTTPHLRGEASITLMSGRRTDEPLVLFGGDMIDYTVFCNEGSHRFPALGRTSGAPRLILSVGGTDYPLNEHGRQMVIGPIGTAMPAVLQNPQRLSDCTLKMLIESADRTREAAQIEPLLKMIRGARRDSDTH